MYPDDYFKHQAKKLIAGQCFCGDCLVSLLKETYTQGASDQKQAALLALEDIEIDPRFDRSDFMQAIKSEAIRAVEDAEPIAAESESDK